MGYKACEEVGMNVGMTESEMKVLFKQAITEVLEENKDLFYELFAEVIEDAGLANAIRESNPSDRVDEKTILDLLAGSE
jgi:hypothetical protein